MRTIRFRRNLKVLLVWMVPFGLLAIVCFAYVTIPTIIDWLIRGQSISTYKVLGAVFISLLIFGEEIFLCHKALSESSIEFSEKAIKKPGIQSSIIAWEEIISITKSKSVLLIRSKKLQIFINLAFYEEPFKIEEYIKLHYIRAKNLDGFEL